METKWYYDLVQKEEWAEEFFAKAPAIIAYEYKDLNNLLADGAIYGAFLKVKDVYETILKFIALLVLSEFIGNEENEQHTRIYDKIFPLLLGNLPSLGNWENVARILHENRIPCGSAAIILEDVLSIYKQNSITHWRNVYYGHGAMVDFSRLATQHDLTEKIKTLHNHFQQNAENYKKIILELETGGIFVVLQGYTNAKQLSYESGNLFIRFEQKRISLIPFIQYIDHGLYFFDSYANKTLQGWFLSYVDGEKLIRKDKVLSDLYQKIEMNLTQSRVKVVSAEDTLLKKSVIDSLERVRRPKNLISLYYIRDELAHAVSSKEKGIFLLQMEDGMGKTTFVKMMDQLEYDEKSFGENVLCRAIYINAFYANTVKTIIRNIKRVLQTNSKTDYLDGDLVEISDDPMKMGDEFSMFLEQIFDYYKHYYYIDKIVLFIDGIDELPASSKPLMFLFPNKSKLPNGVYIVLTARTDNQIGGITKDILSKIEFESKIRLDTNDTRYKKTICDVMSKRLQISLERAESIRKSIGGKLLYLDLAVRSYEQYGEKFLIDNNKKINNFYFENLYNLYGSYYDNIMRVCLVLALSPVPVSLKTLSCLLGEREISFELLFYIYILTPVLWVDRSYEDTLVGITRSEVREIVLKNEMMKNRIVSKWTFDLNDMPFDEELLDSTFHLWLIKLSALDIRQWEKISYINMFIGSLSCNKHCHSLTLSEYEAVRTIFMKLDAFFKTIKTKSKRIINRYIIIKYMALISTTISYQDDAKVAVEKLIKRLRTIEKDSRNTVAKKRDMVYVYLRIADLCVALRDNERAEYYYKKYQELELLNVALQNGERGGIGHIETLISTKKVRGSDWTNAFGFMNDLKELEHRKGIKSRMHSAVITNAYIMENRDNHEGAIKCLKDALRVSLKRIVDPDRRRLEVAQYYFLFVPFYEVTSPDKGISCFERAEKIFNKYRDDKRTEIALIAKQCLESLVSYGSYARSLSIVGDFEKSLEAYKKIDQIIAVTRDKGRIIDPYNLGNIYYDRAYVEYKLGNKDNAILYLTKFIDTYEANAGKMQGLDNTYKRALNTRRMLVDEAEAAGKEEEPT